MLQPAGDQNPPLLEVQARDRVQAQLQLISNGSTDNNNAWQIAQGVLISGNQIGPVQSAKALALFPRANPSAKRPIDGALKPQDTTSPISSAPPKKKKRKKKQRNFKCTFANCTKAFPDNAHLRDHMLSHTKEKNFACGQCGKFFSRKSCLTEQRANFTSASRPRASVVLVLLFQKNKSMAQILRRNI